MLVRLGTFATSHLANDKSFSIYVAELPLTLGIPHLYTLGLFNVVVPDTQKNLLHTRT